MFLHRQVLNVALKTLLIRILQLNMQPIIHMYVLVVYCGLHFKFSGAPHFLCTTLDDIIY
jgi:hypothetical protein